MKKFFVLLPIFCFCIFILCGGNNEDENKQSAVVLPLSTDFLKQTVWKGRLDYPDYFPQPTDYFVVEIQFTDEESGVECPQGETPRITLKSRLYSTNEKNIKTLTLDKAY